MDFTRRILIVDDDAGIRELIGEFLGAHGYDVAVAADPAEMRAALAAGAFDLIVLDVIMPKEDGLTALRQLGPDAPPVIMLSAVGSDVDRIVGLELGADDYLAKPCNPRELLARVRTVLRRNGPVRTDFAAAEAPPSETPVAAEAGLDADPGPGLCFAGWRLDLGMRLLHDPSGTLIALSDGEFRLLRAFAEHPRRVLTRDQLLEWSRGDTSENFDRSIDVQLSRLRRKLAGSIAHGAEELIRTVRNEGYLFVPTVRRDGPG
ncbi:response regulator [Novosphingobium sp.]|uniref:response regulator n=1 Tax=Novosphingobium sp. TaxID=1874826 RepID=UPI0026100E94|nr:response regulator [Novosphingobium sp.]